MPYYERNLMLKGLENIGVGASDASKFTLQNTTITKIKEILIKLAEFDKWALERDENSNNLAIQEWTAGGFSVSGYQKVTIILNQENTNVKVQISSKSRGGQLVDWGANKYNINRIINYLQNPEIPLTKRKVPAERRGFIFLILIMVLGFLAFIIFSELFVY